MFVLTYSWTGSLLHKIFPHISLARLLLCWRDQAWLIVSSAKKRSVSLPAITVFLCPQRTCTPVGWHTCLCWLYKYLCLVCHPLLSVFRFFFSLFPSTRLGFVLVVTWRMMGKETAVLTYRRAINAQHDPVGASRCRLSVSWLQTFRNITQYVQRAVLLKEDCLSGTTELREGRSNGAVAPFRHHTLVLHIVPVCVTLPWATITPCRCGHWVGGTSHKHKHRIIIDLTYFFRHVRTCPTAHEHVFSDGFTSLLIPLQTSPLIASLLLLQSCAFFRNRLSFFISLYGVLHVHMDEEQSSHIWVKMSYF